MYRVVCIAVACIATTLLILPSQAEARHYRHGYAHHAYAHHSYSRRAYAHRGYGYDVRKFRQSWAMASPDAFGGGERVVGNRPAGCPRAFCGCEASLYKFGRIVPELNLASNWRRFPRTAPSPGMAAVRSGHVMILESQVSGNVWNVHDGNSGGHVTREHARSIAGYTIVDPNGMSASYGSSSRFM